MGQVVVEEVIGVGRSGYHEAKFGLVQLNYWCRLIFLKNYLI